MLHLFSILAHSEALKGKVVKQHYNFGLYDTVEIENCQFADISVTYHDGGAIFCDGMGITFSITSCTARNVKSTQCGGFMYLNVDEPLIDRVSTTQCSSNRQGGSIASCYSTNVNCVSISSCQGVESVLFISMKTSNKIESINLTSTKSEGSTFDLRYFGDGVNNIRYLICNDGSSAKDEGYLIIQDQRNNPKVQLTGTIFNKITHVKDTDISMIRNFIYLTAEQLYVGENNYKFIFQNSGEVKLARNCFFSYGMKIFEDTNVKYTAASKAPFNIPNSCPVVP